MKEQTPTWYPLPWTASDARGSHNTPASEDLGTLQNHRTVEGGDKTNPEKSKTTKLTGRLASSVRFDIRPDRARVTFVLAQHDEAGQTTFHQMYSTKDFARRLAGKQLRKGDLVEVAGVWQKSISTGRDGQVTEKPVFYCYGARVR